MGLGRCPQCGKPIFHHPDRDPAEFCHCAAPRGVSPGKPWWQSKTIWGAILTGAFGLCRALWPERVSLWDALQSLGAALGLIGIRASTEPLRRKE